MENVKQGQDLREGAEDRICKAASDCLNSCKWKTDDSEGAIYDSALEELQKLGREVESEELEGTLTPVLWRKSGQKVARRCRGSSGMR